MFKGSIGMSGYNGASTIDAAISAVLGQTFDDFERIDSDHGSTDEPSPPNWPMWRRRANCSGNSGQTALQTRADLQNQADGWTRKMRSFHGGGTAVRFS